ncbi:MAG TPA: hypothetical protein DIT25_00770 [Candidatus Moranbacteria bacterium]|nr:hypothetical protein [Candidatus Moranbacteria bacterium]
MQLPQLKDAKHKAWLYRILSALYDDPFLAGNLYFKGGTCAAMLGYLDRFSVDLDFDFAGSKTDLFKAREKMEKIFDDLGLAIKDQSQKVPQYFLRYPAKEGERNTVKIDMTFPIIEADRYETKRFSEIDRIITCQTPETMFANKLVALIDRYKKKSGIAGRDVYDVHYFFENSFEYDKAVIEARTGQQPKKFFEELVSFVEDKVTNEIIAQDLNVLLPYDKFKTIRKTLKQETLMFLRDEIKRLGKEK